MFAGGGEAVDVMRLGEARGGVGVADGEAGRGAGEDVVADVGGAGDEMVLIKREGVGGVETAEGGLVVEPAKGAGEDGFVAIGAEVSGVAGVVDGGAEEVAASGGQVDDRSFGAGAIKGAVGSAIDLRTVEGGGGDGAEVEVAAYVGGGDGIDEDLVGVEAAAAHVEGDGTASLPCLDGVGAGNLAEAVEKIDFGIEVFLRHECDGGGDPLDGRGDAVGCDGELRSDLRILHDDAAGDDRGAATVEGVADAGCERRFCGEKDEATGEGAADLVGPVHERHGEGDDALSLNELDTSVAERSSEWRGDGASDDYSVGRYGDENGGDEGEKLFDRAARRQKKHVSIVSCW